MSVDPRDMALHYLLEHQHKREFRFCPSRSETNAYRIAFEERGATVEYAEGSMIVSHTEDFRNLLTGAEVWAARKSCLLGFLLFAGIIALQLSVVVAAIKVGGGKYVAWFGFLAVVCLGGAAYERKDRRTRLILALVFAAIAATDLRWGQ